MTRTAVRRHVDVNDGRVVIRKIVVETELSETPRTDAASASDTERREHHGLHRLRGARMRDTRRSREMPAR